MRIAVIGAGISGMLAARLLAGDKAPGDHDVHVFEANDYIGGHTQTIPIDAFGRRYAVDTGFMVFNHQTYRNFTRLLRLLGIGQRDSDMSFSVRCDRTGLEYQGSSLRGLFAQPTNLLRPSFLRMLADIVRFNRQSRELLREGAEDPLLEEYLDRHGYGRAFAEYYLVPMGASIWSAGPEEFRRFPARFIVRFFENHSLLQLRGGPQWKTVVGGAARYVEALMRPLAGRVRLGAAVERIARGEQGVSVRVRGDKPESFDAVVVACHGDQALDLLEDASDAEREILGAFRYQANDVVVHLDETMLPRRRRAWASWNYRVPREAGRRVVLTYNLNRLQGHESPSPICATLNGAELVEPAKILRRLVYHHPIISPAALAAQRRWREINGCRGTYYCGAYWGYGFHEDGARSALKVAECFGRSLESLATSLGQRTDRI